VTVNAFLLTWNPDKYQWADDHIDRFVKQSTVGKSCAFHWSCSNSKKLRRGDRAFLIKLGRHGRGIFASGWITTDAREVNGEDLFGPMGVDVDWDAFLDPRTSHALLDPEQISSDQHWTPQNSGASIDKTTHVALEQLWAAHLSKHKRSAAPRTFTDDELVTAIELEALEGEMFRRFVNHRRRERSLRDAKLVDYRRTRGSLQCEVCTYDFNDVFGVDYAEVHHIKPLAASAGPRVTRLSDLAVLCSNCHRVAHLDPHRSQSLKQLRARLRRG
jgi:5-methylcytosine-specific restriction protein A